MTADDARAEHTDHHQAVPAAEGIAGGRDHRLVPVPDRRRGVRAAQHLRRHLYLDVEGAAAVGPQEGLGLADGRLVGAGAGQVEARALRRRVHGLGEEPGGQQ